MKRGLTIGTVVAVIGLAGAAVYYWKFRPADPPKLRTAQVARRTIAAAVTSTGTLSARITVKVGSQVSGIVKEIFVDYNDHVKKNQLIARLDPQLFRAALLQAQANLETALGNVARARAEARGADKDLARAQALQQNRLIGQSEYDAIVTRVEVTQAQVQVAQGALAQASAAHDQARVNLGYTSIRSPIDGIIISRDVDVGQTVAASLQAPVLFTIAEDLSRMQVHTYVAEADVGWLRPGMDTEFSVDAYPKDKFKGVILEVRSAPQETQGVVTYDAVIDVVNNDLKLRPGMTANVNARYNTREHVLAIPSAALRFQPSKEALDQMSDRARADDREPARKDVKRGFRNIWIQERSGKLRPVVIRTGLADSRWVEILEGQVQEGDKVATESVEPTKKPTPFGRGM